MGGSLDFVKKIFLFALLFVFFELNAQKMKTIDILQNLKPYVEFLEQLKKEETSTLQNGNAFEYLEKSIRCQYSFITLELYCVTKSADSGEFDRRLLCQIKFEIVQDKIEFKEVYHQKPRQDALRLAIVDNKKISGIPWQKEVSDKSFCKEYLEYLAAADEIASISANCASGDNYYPGFYSEIKIGEKGIELNQINHMNSKSLDHKQNYSLRDLQIFIP